MLIRDVKLLKGGRLQRLDIRIEDGRIAEIGRRLHGAGERIDGDGLLALPGGVDPHVHFDDPGYTQREDFLHGSRAAAAAGITTVIDMPCTSVPAVTSAARLKEKLRVVEKKSVVDFGLFGGVSASTFHDNLAETMTTLAPWIMGFKTYFISGMPTFERLGPFQLLQVLRRAAALGLPVLLHAEDFEYVTAATAEARLLGDGPEHYYRSRPEIAEVLAVQTAAFLAETAGADLHVVHVGSAAAAHFLSDRRSCGGAEGTSGSPCSRPGSESLHRITCETGPHYLAFDLQDFIRIGSVLKTTPPVKSGENREELWRLLAAGRIEFVASDHAPCAEEEKNTGSIWSDYAGIPGCCTLLPYLLSEGYLAGRLSLRRLIRVTSENAARRYGFFHRKGGLDVGKDADIVMVDPEASWTVRGGEFLSKGSLTPFEGMRLKGRVEMTILRGEIIYRSGRGVLAEPGSGRFLTRRVREHRGGD